MHDLKQSTAKTISILAIDDNGDPVTGLVNANFTKRISKNGGAFAAMTVTITEKENGWYSLPLTTSHTDTVGELCMTFIATGMKNINLQYNVSSKVLGDLGDQATLDAAGALLTTIDANIDTANAALVVIDNEIAVIDTNVDDIETNLATVNGNIITIDGIVDAIATVAASKEEIADAILNRNVAGGSSVGRTVKQALATLRNKVEITGGVMTVYGTDDTTPLFTAAVVTTAGNPITSIDPAS